MNARRKRKYRKFQIAIKAAREIIEKLWSDDNFKMPGTVDILEIWRQAEENGFPPFDMEVEGG